LFDHVINLEIFIILSEIWLKSGFCMICFITVKQDTLVMSWKKFHLSNSNFMWRNKRLIVDFQKNQLASSLKFYNQTKQQQLFCFSLCVTCQLLMNGSFCQNCFYNHLQIQGWYLKIGFSKLGACQNLLEQHLRNFPKYQLLINLLVISNLFPNFTFTPCNNKGSGMA
jgi:hypothetical protein